MDFSFGQNAQGNRPQVKIIGEEVERVTHFKYLGTSIDEEGGMETEIAKRVGAGWMNWKKCSGVHGFVVGVRCQGSSEPPADGATTPLSQCYASLRNAAWLDPPYTIPSAAHQHCIHTRCILSCTTGGRRAASRREGERENRRWEGRREQGAGGREEAMM